MNELMAAAEARAEEVRQQAQRKGFSPQGQAWLLTLLAGENAADSVYAVAYRRLAESVLAE